MEQRLRFLKGQTYILGIELNKDVEISVGKLGNISFSKGFYLYIGSAKNRLNARLRRHLSQDKKLFWHIDYLLSLDDIQIKQIWIGNKEECQIAKDLVKQECSFINRFGSSDCRCPSHLFFIGSDIIKVKNLLSRKGFKYADKDSF